MDKPERSTPSASPSPKQVTPGTPDAEAAMKDGADPLTTTPRFESTQLEVDALRAMLDSPSDPSHDSPSTS